MRRVLKNFDSVVRSMALLTTRVRERPGTAATPSTRQRGGMINLLHRSKHRRWSAKERVVVAECARKPRAKDRRNSGSPAIFNNR